MNKKIAINILCFGLIFTTGNLLSQDASTNKKHKLTIDEIFKKLDTDGSDMLDPSEVEKSKRTRFIKNFNKIDTNGDGLISREELKARRGHRKQPKKDLQ